MKIEFTQARPIKLGVTLRQLIDRDRDKFNRKEICARIGISEAVLSQYLAGKAMPRLPKLAAFAELFGVDLHFLVFGEQIQPARTIDLGPFQYIDTSLAGLHAKHDAYFSAVGRITSALAQQIDEAARKVVEENDISGGVLHDNEVFVVEQYSQETVLVRMTLDYQFDSAGGQPFRTTPGGRFLPLVAKNLAEGRRYTYILPGSGRDWREPVRKFREVLRSLGVTQERLNACCRIGVTGAPLVAGCVLYHLDADRFQAEVPHLYHRLNLPGPADRREAWFGCTLPPSTKLQANPVMDSDHLDRARRMVSRILREDYQEVELA